MISLPTKTFAAALAKARAIAPASTTLDILKCVMLQGRPENAWLTVTANNLDAQIAIDVDSDIEGQIACCVDLSRLSTAIDVPGDTTKLTMDGDRLEVSTGRSVFKLPQRPIEDFPIAGNQGDTLASFTCEWLGPLIERFIPFVADDNDIRPHLKAVMLRNVDGLLQVGASNTHMAAFTERQIDEKRSFDILIPSRIARGLPAFVPTRAIVKKSGILFLGENMQLVSKLIDGVMPDLKPFFAEFKVDGEYKVKRADALRAVKSCASMSDSKARAVRFGGEDGAPFIEAANVNATNGEARVGLEGSVRDFDIGFHDRVAMTVLESCEDKEITLLRSGVNKIHVFDGDFKAIGMAMRL